MAGEGSPKSASITEGSLVAGKFRVDRLLGEGGMGLVFLAEHLDLERPVAIKIVRDELALREDVVERLLREARTAARLRSDHVARVLDVGRLDGGAPYVVMEFLEGCDLDELLFRRGPIPAEEAVGLLLQACEGVAEAHALGILHRDLKPENLFLTTSADGSPCVKVLDFGISKSPGTEKRSLTNPSMVVGSPDFMSPEQMQGRALAGPESDIWSLGAVLYTLVTDHRPFAADSMQGVYARVLAQEPLAPEARAELPNGLSQVILRCLAKKATERFASVVELARALAPFGPPGSLALVESIERVAAARRPREGAASAIAAGLASSGPPSTPRRDGAPLGSTRGVPQPFATTVGAPLLSGDGPRAKRRTLLWAGAIAFSGIALLFGWAALGASRHQALHRTNGRLDDDVTPEPREARSATLAAADRVAAEPPRATPRSGEKPVETESSASPRSAPRPAPAASAIRPIDAWNPESFGGRM